MLAFSLIRYWWLRPLTPDPMNIETHDPLKSHSFSSLMAPCSGPQPKRQEWAQIPPAVGGSDPIQRSLIEIEQAISEGKDMVMVESEIAGQVFYHYVSHGWLLQENTMFYGSLALFFSYFFPKTWYIYVPCTISSLFHSWLYFRVYKYDRLSQYQAYDDDRHPVSNLITAWVVGQRPDHFKFILKKEKIPMWELFSETLLYSAVISTLSGLLTVEEYIVGGKYATSYNDPSSLADTLYQQAYHSGYFQPAELVPAAPGHYVPSDIPSVVGWFDLPWFNIKFKPMKYDLAVSICLMGGYFMYKAFEHFFGFTEEGGDEADELGREWSNNQKAVQEARSKEVNPHWVEFPTIDPLVVLGARPHQLSKQEQEEEADEITRIVGHEPFGFVKPGYKKNHYGIFV